SLELPVHLSLECLGVACEATETCQSGRCVDANVTDCSADGCGLDAGAVVDPEALAPVWSRVLQVGRYEDLFALGGRVIAVGRDEDGPEAVAAAILQNG